MKNNICYVRIKKLITNNDKKREGDVKMYTKVLTAEETVLKEIDILEKNYSNETINTKKDIEEICLDDAESARINYLMKNKKQNIILKVTNSFLKRLIDIIGAIVGILLLIPMTLIIGTINLLNKENGPIFYTQKRIGKNGKIFRMYKYRTMIVGADEKLKEILKNNDEMRKEWEENRKLKDDPRITKIGKILRKTSIDEFPQFINVLKGELSLVGPRAVVYDEIEKFGIYKKDVLSVKPGITGYWAANGRSDTSYEERVFMETKYAMNCNVIMDVKILLKTISSVLKKEGAV